jgi:hypothetical protein
MVLPNLSRLAKTDELVAIDKPILRHGVKKEERCAKRYAASADVRANVPTLSSMYQHDELTLTRSMEAAAENAYMQQNGTPIPVERPFEVPTAGSAALDFELGEMTDGKVKDAFHAVTTAALKKIKPGKGALAAVKVLLKKLAKTNRTFVAKLLQFVKRKMANATTGTSVVDDVFERLELESTGDKCTGKYERCKDKDEDLFDVIFGMLFPRYPNQSLFSLSDFVSFLESLVTT